MSAKSVVFVIIWYEIVCVSHLQGVWHHPGQVFPPLWRSHGHGAHEAERSPTADSNDHESAGLEIHSNWTDLLFSSFNQARWIKPCVSSGQQDLAELLLYLCDSTTTIHAFLDIFPAACSTFHSHGFLSRWTLGREAALESPHLLMKIFPWSCHFLSRQADLFLRDRCAWPGKSCEEKKLWW